ncbi:hypothetical protein [Aerosticca soli]|uniref:TPR repeat protein n=1 Tax=Aerosticca soli TaxID=2010829 RepID=A0A2Z6E1H8_9GAMM|nr:hypothetical protein [Aerosticca soli]BBD78833.1 TPR repeat protein [Aerosticca soli]
MNERIAHLRAQCGGPRDGAMLRFALGCALLDDGQAPAAVAELAQAVTFDPAYSAAWKMLGKAQLAVGDDEGAARAWREGIAAARARGDRQAEKEMAVFLRRLEKKPDG